MRMTYVPDDDSLLAELLPALWVGEVIDRDTSLEVRDILNTLRNIGYTISREVEVTGPMAEALRTLGDPDAVRSVYVQRDRPQRRSEKEIEK